VYPAGFPSVQGPGEIRCNGSYGATCDQLGQISFDTTTITTNGTFDLYCQGMGNIGDGSGGASSHRAIYNTTSPAVGVVGNGNSIINAGL
jgi:hypothetical protein